MNLIKIEKPNSTEYHGIHTINIDKNVVTLTVGVWNQAIAATTLIPIHTYTIVIHFEQWLPEYLYNLFPLLTTLPELSTGIVVDSRSEA